MPISKKRAEAETASAGAVSPLAARIAATQVRGQRGFGQYLTTCDSCLCADRKYRGRVCKHMLVEREKAEAERLKAEADEREKRLYEELLGFF